VIPVAGLALIWASVVWARKRRHSPTSVRTQNRIRIAGELYGLAFVGLAILFWRVQMPLSPYHESSFARAVVSLWQEEAVDNGQLTRYDFTKITGLKTESLSTLSAGELISLYRRLAHAPEWEKDPRYFGKEKGDNVIFFVLETTSYKFIPPGDDLQEFPTLRQLAQKSFVGEQHYTTLPNTWQAVYSLFSSWYPPDSMNSATASETDRIVPDFLVRLASQGYATAVFSPAVAQEFMDERLFDIAGFQKYVFPDPSLPLPSVPGYEGQPDWKAKRIGRDLESLDQFKQSLDQWLSTRQKFVAAFLPQMSHSPYPDMGPEAVGNDLIPRARAILEREDAMFGQIISELQQHGALDKTIIVVLGDHGTRTLAEDPTLRRGTIDESSFHVPLYIYAPQTLSHQEKIHWITSHIDIAPTVLDLLGEEGNRESEEGTPIWNPGISGRTDFFFAGPIFGADGYYSKGKFYMWNHLSDSVYVNSEAKFDTTDIVPNNSQTAEEVRQTILTVLALQKAWHNKFTMEKKDLPK
jgi:Sulfatase